MKKVGKKVEAVEKKVAKHAVKQLQGTVEDEEAEIARVLAESKALYVSISNIYYVIGTRGKASQSLLRTSSS